ncbi:MAG TPA: MFS transporter [Mycobacteriales bacterium]|nr:MFS transporter [Mycobacteriales bacterium]
MTAEVAGSAGRTRRLLQLTTLVSSLDRFAMPPMLLAIAHGLDVPLARAAQAASAYYLAYGLLQPVWGLVSDRLGLVRTIRLTLLLAAAGTATAALATGPGALIASRAVAGACFGAAIPSTLVYVGDTVPSARRQRDITDLMVGVACGTAVATALAGVVADRLSWRWAFAGTGTLAVLLVALLRRLPEPASHRRHESALTQFRSVFAARPARLVIALAFVEGAILLGGLTYLPAAVQAGGADATTAGLVTAAFGVATLAAAPAVARLSRRVRPARLVAVGAACLVGAWLLVAVSAAAAVALVSCLLLGAAWAAMHSTLQTWATQVVPAARATAVAMFACALFAGSAIGALVFGGLASADRYGLIFAWSAAVAVPLGVAGAIGRARFTDPERPEPVAPA